MVFPSKCHYVCLISDLGLQMGSSIFNLCLDFLHAVGTTSEEEMEAEDDFKSDPDIFLISDDSQRSADECLPSGGKGVSSEKSRNMPYSENDEPSLVPDTASQDYDQYDEAREVFSVESDHEFIRLPQCESSEEYASLASEKSCASVQDVIEKTSDEDLPDVEIRMQQESEREGRDCPSSDVDSCNRKGFKRKQRNESGSNDPRGGEGGVPLEKRNKLSSLSSIHEDDGIQESPQDSTDSVKIIPESTEMSSRNDQETCFCPDSDYREIAGNPMRTSTQIDGADKVISLTSSENEDGSQPFTIEHPATLEAATASSWISKEQFVDRCNVQLNSTRNKDGQLLAESPDIPAGNEQGWDDSQELPVIDISESSRKETSERTEREEPPALKITSGQSEGYSEELPHSGAISEHSVVNSGCGDKSNPIVTPTLFSSGSSSIPNSGSGGNKPGHDETPELFSSGGSTEDRIPKHSK